MMQTSSTNQSARREAEKRLDIQARMLRSIATLIASRTAWSEWPKVELAVLVGALRADGQNSFEEAKARNLSWHLFRGEMPEFDIKRISEFADAEDRVRADLSGLVELGAGRKILATTSHTPSGFGP